MAMVNLLVICMIHPSSYTLSCGGEDVNVKITGSLHALTTLIR